MMARGENNRSDVICKPNCIRGTARQCVWIALRLPMDYLWIVYGLCMDFGDVLCVEGYIRGPL